MKNVITRFEKFTHKVPPLLSNESHPFVCKSEMLLILLAW
jgi:hypothetical protein